MTNQQMRFHSKRVELEVGIAQCDREIARCRAEIMIKVDPCGALLGLSDWFGERILLMREMEKLDKKVTECGATSSHCPDLTQIPFAALVVAAERFEHGEKKHGRNNWRAGIGDRKYTLERLNHIIRHCYALAAQIDGRGGETWIEDSPAGNVGAIAWGAAFLSETVPVIFGDTPEFLGEVE